jgi:23S rRNA (guanosine2251-2'-O)-methyltransferase
LPARRAAGITPAARKVAAGAAEIVPVARVANLRHALGQAKDAGLWTVGLAAGAPQGLWTYDSRGSRLALVLGSEDRGLSRGVEAVCDELVGVPLAGRLESLNVAVAGAVAMFELARRPGAGP